MGGSQSIDDSERDNALYLLDFLQSHLLILPHTFVDLPSSRKVSYKEMTSSTDSPDDFDVTDWTTVDDAAVSHPIFPYITFEGSIFQQLIDSRHLPLFFVYRSSFLPKTPVTHVPKLDYSLTSDFYAAVETSLLSSTGNAVCNTSSSG